MPLRDVLCDQDHRSEVLVPATAETFICPECGGSAKRVYGGYQAASVHAKADDMRGMFRRFNEASQELEHRGYGGPSPWSYSKHRAKSIDNAGENTTRRQW